MDGNVKMTTKIILFSSIPLVLNILDLLTTYIGISYFDLVETNPLFGELMIIFKLTFFTSIIPLNYFIVKKQNNLLIPVLIFVSIFIIVFTVIVTHNILLIKENF